MTVEHLAFFVEEVEGHGPVLEHRQDQVGGGAHQQEGPKDWINIRKDFTSTDFNEMQLRIMVVMSLTTISSKMTPGLEFRGLGV